jgi:dephospho-CoA kinase
MYYAAYLASIEKVLISEDIILVYHIIGLTGRNAAGKGTVASFLKKKSFVYHSLSDTLREELKRRKLEESRDNLIMIGNSLRESGGPGILADLMISNLISLENHIVDSIRNPIEVKSLRREYENHSFILISIDAKPEIRYERLKQRDRAGDSSSWKEFITQEKLEESSSDPNKQQLFATINEADYHIDNSGSLSNLEDQIGKVLDNL